MSLHYPHTHHPAAGELTEVASGVFWLRMPLPFQLDHINLWLLRDGDGWTMVDTGFATDGVRAVWLQVLAELDAPVRRLIVEPHEVVHVTQHKRGVDAGWWPRVVSHSALYLCSVATDDAAEYLGKVEGDAYAVSADVELWLTGRRRPIESVVDSLRRQYALRPAGAAAASAVLHSHYATQDDGGVSNVTVGRFTIDWLNAHVEAGTFGERDDA